MKRSKGLGLGEGLERLASRLDRKGAGGLAQARVADAWRRVAGPSVNDHTTGAHLRDTEMVVFVDSPVWATELSALSEHYRRAVNEAIGQQLVSAVRFAVSNRVEQVRHAEYQESEKDAYYDRDKVPSVLLSEHEREQVRVSAAAIEDTELREAVIRATIADLEWKRGIEAAKRREGPAGGP
jgi:hypothetical protein